MKTLVALLLVAILAGSVTLPNVFSDDGQDDQNDNNKTDMQENNDHIDNENINTQENNPDNKVIQFEYSNTTSTGITLPNGIHMAFSYSNGTNTGQQISSFVHQLHDVFKQQKDLSKQTIKDCREKTRESNPADRKNIMNQCKADLKQINQQFSSEHQQLQLDFKQFREMIISDNSKNHTKSTTTQNDIKTQHTIQNHFKHNEQNSRQHGKGHQQNHGRQD
ncbi:MAG: hypothetical protein KGH95_07820 [Thaumarchaeota archaeon]|nr:hypothetical protein [Nitrososphaerota archaeon]